MPTCVLMGLMQLSLLGSMHADVPCDMCCRATSVSSAIAYVCIHLQAYTRAFSLNHTRMCMANNMMRVVCGIYLGAQQTFNANICLACLHMQVVITLPPAPGDDASLEQLVTALVENDQFIALLVNNEAFLDRVAGDDRVPELLQKRRAEGSDVSQPMSCNALCQVTSTACLRTNAGCHMSVSMGRQCRS